MRWGFEESDDFIKRVIVNLLVIFALIVPVGFFSAFSVGKIKASSDDFKPKPLDVILIVDQSNSMFKESDPGVVEKNPDGTIKRVNGRPVYKTLPIRQLAAQYFVDYLHVDQIPGVDNRVGVIYFGETSKLVAPLTSVSTEENVQRLHELLSEAPPDLHWTDTNSAFEAAYKELFESPRSNPDHEHVIVFLTDGHPQIAYPWPIEDTKRSDGSVLEGKKSYYMRHKELMRRFKEKGIRVYTVIIAKTGYVDWKDKDLQDPRMASLGFKNFANLWQQAAAETGGEYFRVGVNKNKELNKADLLPIYHTILAELLNVSPLQRQQGNITSEDQTIPIAVGNCKKLIVTVLKGSENTKITLLSPDNHPVPPSNSRRGYLLYTIQKPASGNWWLRFVGGKGTSYSVSLDCADITLQARILSPGSSFQQCKPMPIVAKLISEEGQPVNDAIVGVTILLPDGTKRSVALDNKGNGKYQKTFTDTKQQGEYRLTLEAHQGDRVVKKVRQVSLMPVPYAVIVSPPAQTRIAGGNITVEIGVNVGCNRATGDKDIEDGKAKVVAYLRSESGGNTIGPIELHDNGKKPDKKQNDAVFTGVFSNVPEGKYILSADLSVPDLDVEDHAEQEVIVSKLAVTPVPSPPPARAGHWLDSNAVSVRAGKSAQFKVHFNSLSLKDEQVVSVELSGFPSGITLQTKSVKVIPGKKDVEQTIVFSASKDLAPSKNKGSEKYQGTLGLKYPDGTTTHDPVSITILPPPASPWPYILLIVGLVVVGSGAIAAYSFVKGKGELVGRLVFESTPEGMEMPDEELTIHGNKFELSLESPEIESSVPQEMLSDIDIDEDYTYEMGPEKAYADSQESEPLNAVLMFFAERGKREAQVRVVKSNRQVTVNGVGLFGSQKLKDGDVIEVGEYRIKYEYLGVDSGDTENLWGNGEDEYGGDEYEENEYGESEYGSEYGEDAYGDNEYDSEFGHSEDEDHDSTEYFIGDYE